MHENIRFAADSLLMVLGEMGGVWVAIFPPASEELNESKGIAPGEIVNLIKPRLWAGSGTDQGAVYFRPLNQW